MLLNIQKITTVKKRTYEDFVSKKKKSLIPQAPFYIKSIPPWEKYKVNYSKQAVHQRNKQCVDLA